MVRPDVVRRKLSQLHGYLNELEPYREADVDEYLAPAGPRRTVERLIQLIVECAVDINVHVATEEEGTPPSDYRTSFARAVRVGMIPAQLEERLAPSAGLRNVLVHEYGDIDDRRVHAAIGLVLDGFRDFLGSVRRWVDDRYPDE